MMCSLIRLQDPSLSPVDVGHVLHHEPPQVFVEVGQTRKSPLQDLCVLRVQQRGDQNEEVGEVGVEVGLQVSSQLHHQAGGRGRVSTSHVYSLTGEHKSHTKHRRGLTPGAAGRPNCSSLPGAFSDSPL